MKLSVLSFGGGVNSSAMLAGLHERGERPDLILFADTGGEKPGTYEHVRTMDAWLESVGFPPITLVREERFTLEEECLSYGSLPSIVVGSRACSDKFKIRPQERWLRAHYPQAHILKLIGFDAGEAYRAKRGDEHITKRATKRYPLIEWGWDREACIAALNRAGIPIPPKSSCFFCPEMKEREILQLRDEHPELLERALEMERNNSKLHSVKGLARTHSWQQVIDYHRDQRVLPLLPPREDGLPCDCIDESAP